MKTKKLGRGINQYKRVYYKEYGALFTVLFVSFIGFLVQHQPNEDMIYVREQEVYLKPVVVNHPEDESIETKIRQHFPRSHKTMIAIAHAESNMNPNATGYNCYYYKGKATTTKIVGGSKACKVEDRHMAWSLDCGLLQLHNGKGNKQCPKETVDQHLKRAAELSRVQGLEAWVTYWNGSHKKYLAQN